ncbi:hypothetical protein THAOC_28758, partial [Thalassiosira oceanica]
MPSLYTGSSAAPPAATSLAATRSLDRQAKTLNDELLLTVEALPRFLPLHWHTVKDLEKLLKEGGLDLPDKLLSNALRSVKDGERGWSKNKFSNKIYFCPGGNNKIFDSPKLQKREGPIQIIDDGYYTQFEFKFIGKYLKSSDDTAAGAASSMLTTSTSSTGDESARGTGEQGNASNADATSTSTAGNETARGTAAGERGNEPTTSTADESTLSSGGETASGSSLVEQGNASTPGVPSTSTAGNETTRGTAAGERGNEATT